VREWTLTLPRQLPLWEMESRWTPKISESDLRGQNSMAYGVPYNIRKLLEHRCLKWDRIAHLDIWNTNYGQKKRARNQIVNLTSNQKKSRIDPIYFTANNVQHIVGKLSTRATTLLWIAPRSEVCSQSYGAPKFRESRLARFWDSHSRVPKEKSHLDVGPMERCRVYYKGEGGRFPQIWAVVSLVCPCCPWLVLAPGASTMH
jgi:hypothetical protein